MSRFTRSSWTLFLAALALALTFAATAFAQSTSQKLFFIQRSKNANEVHYDARVTANGTLQAKDPVDAYWLRKASDGSRASIGTFQKIAYGFDVDPGPEAGTHTMRLTALKERALTLLQVNGRWRADPDQRQAGLSEPPLHRDRRVRRVPQGALRRHLRRRGGERRGDPGAPRQEVTSWCSVHQRWCSAHQPIATLGAFIEGVAPRATRLLPPLNQATEHPTFERG